LSESGTRSWISCWRRQSWTDGAVVHESAALDDLRSASDRISGFANLPSGPRGNAQFRDLAKPPEVDSDGTRGRIAHCRAAQAIGDLFDFIELDLIGRVRGVVHKPLLLLSKPEALRKDGSEEEYGNQQHAQTNEKSHGYLVRLVTEFTLIFSESQAGNNLHEGPRIEALIALHQTAASDCRTSRGSRWRRKKDSRKPTILSKFSARRMTRSMRSRTLFLCGSIGSAAVGRNFKQLEFSKTGFMARRIAEKFRAADAREDPAHAFEDGLAVHVFVVFRGMIAVAIALDGQRRPSPSTTKSILNARRAIAEQHDSRRR